jgi:hypothetical protein
MASPSRAIARAIGRHADGDAEYRRRFQSVSYKTGHSGKEKGW